MNGLALSLILLIFPPQSYGLEPHTLVDTDGKVPVKTVCQPHGNKRWGKWWIGHYEARVVGDEVVGTIYLNDCKNGQGYHMSEEERRVTLWHEIAHSLGWSHYQGTPEINPSFYP